MADKMMRIAARSDAGTAKAIRADEQGNVITRLVGNVDNQKKSYLPVLNVKEGWIKRINPSAVYASNGYIYVGLKTGELKKLTPNGDEVWSYVGNTTQVNAIYVDEGDNVYLGLASRTIIKLDSYARAVWKVTLSGQQLPAEGVWCIKKQGTNVYIGHKYLVITPHVIKIDDQTGKVVYWMPIPDASGGWEIYDLDVDSSNNIYATSRHYYVVKLSQSGVKQAIVSVNGTQVTRVSGDNFTLGTEGQTVFIDGEKYIIAAVSSTNSITLTTDAGVKNNALFASGALTRTWTCVTNGDRVRQIKLGSGSYFYTAANDAKVRKFDQTDKSGNWGTEQQLWSFDLHTSAVISLCVDKSGNVYSGGLDDVVYKIDGNTGTEMFKYTGQKNDITSLAVLDDRLYSASNDGTLRQLSNELQLFGYKGD